MVIDGIRENSRKVFCYVTDGESLKFIAEIIFEIFLGLDFSGKNIGLLDYLRLV